jgi:ketosteroid isomerase-like protein
MTMLKNEIIQDWLDAWNHHDLDRIMEHYADNIEFTAETVVKRWAKADGKLKGKEELRRHFSKGLELAPDIQFTLDQILWAPNGYAVLYHRENGNRVLDAVELDDSGLAIKVTAYYLHQQS